MKNKISKDWQDWIKVNIERGCDLDEIYGILLKEGFNAENIEQYMHYQPKTLKKARLNNDLPTSKKKPFFKRIKLLYKKYKTVRNKLLEEAQENCATNLKRL